MELPEVSIVVTTFLPESKPYLDACMASIANLNYPKELLEVILVGKKGYTPEYENVLTIAPDMEQFSNSVGLNFGMRQTDLNSKHILILNDDCILTKDSLLAMVLAVGENEMIVGPISNCDNFWRYVFQFPFDHMGSTVFIQERFYRYDDWKDMINSMMNARSAYQVGIIMADFLCFYATLIPRKVINKVGYLDEGFDTGPDDLDYSKRCMAVGIRCGIVTSSLIWHFGGATSEKTVTPEMRDANAKVFKEKWGEDQSRV